ECHRVECKDRFAGFIHRFDVVLETSRRRLGAQPSGDIDAHWEVIGVKGGLKDIADIKAVVHVLAGRADTDYVTGRSDVGASVCTQGDVVAASAVVERAITDGRVGAT